MAGGFGIRVTEPLLRNAPLVAQRVVVEFSLMDTASFGPSGIFVGQRSGQWLDEYQ